jgi:hypothetical protein
MFNLRNSARLATLAGCAAAIVACAKKDETPVDTTAAVTPPPAATTTSAPAAVNLADVAGKWNVRSVPATGDTTPTTYVLSATNTTSGWTLTFPKRPVVKATVTTDGDSVMVDAGPFSSVRRKGVQVTTHTVEHFSGDNMTGVTTAHYNVKTADSVLTLNTTGTREKK